MHRGVRSVVRVVVVCLALALAVPAISLAQSQGGTSGDGSGSQSGAVTNSQTNSQSAVGSGNVQNATNQNCVAGRDCVNNNVTNQNAGRTFEAAPRGVRRARVRRVVLAHTGSDLTLLFVLGGALTAGGLGTLTLSRRRGLRSLA
jgi:hypothetical protein